ncbi:MAG: adenylate/guanylate cyclase domain-containing protein [Chthonomonadaceae bacterium]|jgi:class 3 adenylate cyclase|nr:adenylate/guanylate cyclase domain-containing protein [Chthonomonadaceae bacterium]
MATEATGLEKAEPPQVPQYSSQTVPERGLLALLQTDVYGFTKAVSESEEDVALRVSGDLAKFTEIATHHAGRVLANRGDGLKIVFASPVEAMRAAINMQSHVLALNAKADGAKVRHRIGAHFGDMIIVGNQILGKVAAVTMRLEEMCPPGKVCYSDEVHKLVEQAVKFPRRFAGFHEVKNVPGSVKVWIGSSPDDFSEDVALLPKVSETAIKYEKKIASEAKKTYWRGFLTGFLFATVGFLVWWSIRTVVDTAQNSIENEPTGVSR